MTGTIIVAADGLPCRVLSGMHNSELSKMSVVLYRQCEQFSINLSDILETPLHEDLQAILRATPERTMFKRWHLACSRVIAECLPTMQTLSKGDSSWKTVHDLLHTKAHALQLTGLAGKVTIASSSLGRVAAYYMQPVSLQDLETTITTLPRYASSDVLLRDQAEAPPKMASLVHRPEDILYFRSFDRDTTDADTGELDNLSRRCVEGWIKAERTTRASPAATDDSFAVLGLVVEGDLAAGVLVSQRF
ncbi:hypothetical protein AMS68_006318 [Peltaster fructicola]|uniref:Uncharacterized protein n=1 Tax=Peltaster fructicola TaxID=286661 RepID=A0A6H0Y1L5_9PEZI|nr:hypothetical protein AMS68_006318 [Peltaster fructicola]